MVVRGDVPPQELQGEPDKVFEAGWWLYVVIVGCLIIGGLAVYLFWWRRRQVI